MTIVALVIVIVAALLIAVAARLIRSRGGSFVGRRL